MLPLLAIALLAQTPQHRLFLQPNLPRQGGGLAPPAFAFATASGVGMGTACACAAITGSKGETVTFSRASSGTCLKASTTTGIANGDMVTCSSDQPRIGTGGGTGLKILTEESRSNLTLRSQEIDNAAWASNNSVVGDPTVTANQATGPDTTTMANAAERIQFPATSGAQYSQRYQLVNCGATASASVFVRGNGMSGTLDICGAATCTACAFTSTGWSRCVRENATDMTVAWTIANNSANNGGIARAANDVFVIGAQCETGAFATSYIATTGASATRAADIADLNITFGSGTTGFSMAATSIHPLTTLLTTGSLAGVPGNGSLGGSSGSTSYSSPFDANSTQVYTQDCTGACSVNSYAGSIVVAGTSNRYASYNTGTNLFGCVNGTCDTGVASTWSAPTWTRYRLGHFSNVAGYINGWIGDVCLDPSPTRCR